MSRISTKETLLANQRRWATANDIAVDHRGYLTTYMANLWRPMSVTAKSCFDRGSGSELRDEKTRPAKMRALHSSSALAVNVFDYWCDRASKPLLDALGLEPAVEPPRFEAKFPTGLDGNPPNLDLAIRLKSGLTVAIESKFCEWITPKRSSKPPFKEKYFSPVADLWAGVGLSRSQSLANDLQAKVERFVHLDAPQLLKHALGLGTNLNDQFALFYLYYDWPSRESETHLSEIKRFADRVGPELRFRAISYQDLFGRLTQVCSNLDDDYAGYLRKRYFENAV